VQPPHSILDVYIDGVGSKTTNGRRQQQRHDQQQKVGVSELFDVRELIQASTTLGHPRRRNFKFAGIPLTTEKR